MKNAELWGGFAWLAFSVFVVFAGRRHGIGAVNDPGSGFLLFWLGLLMCAFSAALVAVALRAGGPAPASLWAGTRWGKVLVVMVSLCAFALLLNTLGFLLAAIPLLLVLLRAIDPVPWPVALPVGIGAPLAVWWLLKKLLLIQLPSGVLGIG
ncbi:MAG TPA: tripartite tricarboxylate transporter TctB family protein [Candidatus Limnocylindrales bacterium]|nr:tripartite tricarboxylate transporter TctB family protein [Candidatus Limnocylindrales bacterium]